MPSASSSKPSVTLSADPSGHFVAPGSINGASVMFLLDTGASNVTLPASEARRMGIDYKAGQMIGVSTANGVIPAWRVSFSNVRVGNINLNQVEGIVVETEHGTVRVGGGRPLLLIAVSNLLERWAQEGQVATPHQGWPPEGGSR